MFNSQIPNKRMHNPYMSFQTHPDMSMYQMPVSQEMYFNDNRSMYSGSTQVSSQTVNSLGLKKKLNDEMNSVLSDCIENILPKLVEECAENIFLRISLELNKQAKEIEEIKDQINSFDGVIQEKLPKNITPMKNLKKVNEDVNYINGLIAEQKVKLDGMVKSQSEDIVETMKAYLVKLKDTVDGEKKLTEDMTNVVKEKNVDIVAMKRMIENKIGYLAENMKLTTNAGKEDNSVVSSEKSRFEEILELLGTIKEKTKNVTTYVCENLDTESKCKKPVTPRLVIKKENYESCFTMNNLPSKLFVNNSTESIFSTKPNTILHKRNTKPKNPFLVDNNFTF
jgi:hypothetical protein